MNCQLVVLYIAYDTVDISNTIISSSRISCYKPFLPSELYNETHIVFHYISDFVNQGIDFFQCELLPSSHEE